MISGIISGGLNGAPSIPGDKSISHRSIIIPSIADGECEIENILNSDDVNKTIDAFKLMGVKIEKKNNIIRIYGKGLNSLKKPSNEIYLGNSGTSARLLLGLLSWQKFSSKLIGDNSLSSRPMKRITIPLERMGAKFESKNGSLPININGVDLKATDIDIKIPSAQIKSGLLLAALNTEGISKITENSITRDHTEIMLDSFGAHIEIKNESNKKIIHIEGKKELKPNNIIVPSDLSSSAFFIVAALINKNSLIKLENINNNPTRNGILKALEKMGAKIIYKNQRTLNKEPICDIEIKSSELNGCHLDESFAELMIDEYPILSVAASFANSPSVFKGLKELRVKESDRLELIHKNLVNCGVECKIEEDNLFINPKKNYTIKHSEIITNYDHRIAMSFAIMGSKIGPLNIRDADSINTSFPSFINEFNKIGGNIS